MNTNSGADPEKFKWFSKGNRKENKYICKLGLEKNIAEGEGNDSAINFVDKMCVCVLLNAKRRFWWIILYIECYLSRRGNIYFLIILFRFVGQWSLLMKFCSFKIEINFAETFAHVDSHNKQNVSCYLLKNVFILLRVYPYLLKC